MKTKKQMKRFNEHQNDNMVKDIIKILGSTSDQRLSDERKIYTEDELSSMEYEEILKIYNKIFHPIGRTW